MKLTVEIPDQSQKKTASMVNTMTHLESQFISIGGFSSCISNFHNDEHVFSNEQCGSFLKTQIRSYNAQFDKDKYFENAKKSKSMENIYLHNSNNDYVCCSGENDSNFKNGASVNLAGVGEPLAWFKGCLKEVGFICF